MEPNQVDAVAAAVFRRLQQILGVAKPGFARQVVGDVLDVDRDNRVHDHVSLVHGVAATGFHMEPLPDPDGAPDAAAADTLAKMFREDHVSYPLPHQEYVKAANGLTRHRAWINFVM